LLLFTCPLLACPFRGRAGRRCNGIGADGGWLASETEEEAGECRKGEMVRSAMVSRAKATAAAPFLCERRGDMGAGGRGARDADVELLLIVARTLRERDMGAAAARSGKGPMIGVAGFEGLLAARERVVVVGGREETGLVVVRGLSSSSCMAAWSVSSAGSVSSRFSKFTSRGYIDSINSAMRLSSSSIIRVKSPRLNGSFSVDCGSATVRPGTLATSFNSGVFARSPFVILLFEAADEGRFRNAS